MIYFGVGPGNEQNHKKRATRRDDEERIRKKNVLHFVDTLIFIFIVELHDDYHDAAHADNNISNSRGLRLAATVFVNEN